MARVTVLEKWPELRSLFLSALISSRDISSITALFCNCNSFIVIVDSQLFFFKKMPNMQLSHLSSLSGVVISSVLQGSDRGGLLKVRRPQPLEEGPVRSQLERTSKSSPSFPSKETYSFIKIVLSWQKEDT